MPLERIHRLVHERHAVGEEEHPFRPVAAHEQVGQRDHGAGLARASRHHQQCLAVVVLLERLGNSADAARLVEALDDGRIDLGAREWLAAAATLNDELQLGLLVEALHGAWRVHGVVPQPVLVAVGVEDQRALAEVLFKAVGVEFGLLLPHARIAASALGFDQAERLTVVTPEHVVHEALGLVVWHACDFELAVPRLVERPARLLQQQVDEVVAGLAFGVVVRIGLRGRSLPSCGHLRA